MLPKQYCHTLSALLPPKGAAPTTTCSVPTPPSQRVHGKQSTSIHTQALSGTYYRSLPDQPGNASPIRSTPKNPTQTHQLRASANEESAQPLTLPGGGPENLKFSNPIIKWLDIVNRTFRPYASIGGVLAVSSASFLPLTSVADLTPAFFLGFSQAFTAAVFVTLYITAVNQVYDVEIDRINRPYLPLVTGEISLTAVTLLGAAFVALSLVVALTSESPALMAYVVIVFFLGTAYSAKLPLLRWKSNPFLALFTIVSLGGPPIQLPIFFHIQVYALKKQMMLTKPAMFSSAVMSFFLFIIALVKDIHDVEGDKANGIQTFATWFGQERVFNFCVGSLMITYAVCMGIGATSTDVVCRTVSVLGHGILAAVYWLFSRNVDPKRSASAEKHDSLLWKLLYAEYFLVHFIR